MSWFSEIGLNLMGKKPAVRVFVCACLCVSPWGSYLHGVVRPSHLITPPLLLPISCSLVYLLYFFLGWQTFLSPADLDQHLDLMLR